VLLYYITDRKQFTGDEASRRRALLEKIAEAAHYGVDFIQLREKDLAGRELEFLANEAVSVVRKAGSRTRLLINSRVDVAIASQADGVHLRSDDVSPEDVRSIYGSVNSLQTLNPVIGVSCHDVKDVMRAASRAATFAVLAPVFEKQGGSPLGLKMLALACLQKVPVLALGGITLENFTACLSVGAAGIAGIRLFQQGDLRETVARLRQ